MAKNTENALRLRLHKINMQHAGFVVKAQGSAQMSSLVSFEDSDNRSFFDRATMNLRGSGGGTGFGGKLKRGSSGLGGGHANMI